MHCGVLPSIWVNIILGDGLSAMRHATASKHDTVLLIGRYGIKFFEMWIKI